MLFSGTIIENLAFQEEGIVWATDWWKIIIIAFSALLFLFLLIKLALYILRIIGVIICVAIGGVGGWLTQLLFSEKFAERLPERLQTFSPFIVGAIGFLICFGLAVAVMTMIRKPAQSLEKKKE
ncbi:MAG: hypothetical protein MJ106_04535 [Lentisphaeria bacterium]|nr:hypothetical protein [Lentisphaeria bacterium]